MDDSDDSFYRPGHIIPSRVPQPGRHIWTRRKDSHEVRCELRIDGEWETEVQLFRNGGFYGGRRFPSFERAQRFALEECNGRNRIRPDHCRLAYRPAQSFWDGVPDGISHTSGELLGTRNRHRRHRTAFAVGAFVDT